MKGTTPAKAASARKKRRFTQDDFQLFLLSLPSTIWYLLLCYLPMFVPVIVYFFIFKYLPMGGIVIAFKNYKISQGIFGSAWCGLDNFRFLFGNNKETTINMFRNTIGYNIIFIVLGIVLPVALAIMINHLRSEKLAKVTQTAMFLPHFLSWVVVGYFVFAFLSTDNGLVNRSIMSLNGTPVKWYQWEAVGYWLP